MFRSSDRTTTMSSLSSPPSWAFVLVFLLSLLPLASSERLIQSKSLNPCQQNSKFSASLFNFIFTPENRTVHIDVVGVSSITGNITAEVEVIAYGYRVLRQTFDPCNLDLPGLCPMSTGQFTMSTNFLDIGEDVIKRVPGKRVPSSFPLRLLGDMRVVVVVVVVVVVWGNRARARGGDRSR